MIRQRIEVALCALAVALIVWFGFGCDSRTIYHNVTGPTIHDTITVELPHHHGRGK